MDDFKYITKTTSIVQISSILEKLYKKIHEERIKKTPELNIKELDFLKAQCKNDNIRLSLMSCQCLVKLANTGLIDTNNVLNLFLTVLPNSSTTQQSAITESIVNILILNLKKKTEGLKADDKFECPFGIKTLQHPLITIAQTDGINMIDVANKISGICSHQDKKIQKYGLEYLRPVLLYIFCNPQTQPESRPIWTILLEQAKRNEKAKNLINEIITWSKINTSATCLFASILMIETLSVYKSSDKLEDAADLTLYMAVIVNQLVQFGLDPRASLICILNVLKVTKNITKNFYNILLIILADTLHIISPTYLPDLLRIFNFIIVLEHCGNQYILNMILDGAIQWMSQTTFIPEDGITLANQLIKAITTPEEKRAIVSGSEELVKVVTSDYKSPIARYLHPKISLAADFASLAESFEESECKNIFTFVDNLNTRLSSCSALEELGQNYNPAEKESTNAVAKGECTVEVASDFGRKIYLFLRALFLSKDPSVDCWFKIYQAILTIIKANEDIAYDFLMTYIYKLSIEINPEVQLELLRGLPCFAVSKRNIPMILSTIKTLSNGKSSIFCMDLYLRLWRQEIRTYQFLIKHLSEPNRDNSKSFEYNVAKAYTIREICIERPSQYGRDLVKHLSDILNTSSDDLGDLATSIALDAIVALCESNTVNIISTWKTLSARIRHEKRPKSLKSLYNFFGHVPLLKTTTLEYERLVNESLDNLWSVIATSQDPEIIHEALKALAQFYLANLMSLKHIPVKFKQINPSVLEDINMDQIPGECWIEVLQKIHPESKFDAADMLSQFIRDEINSFRSGIYHVPEGRSEPRTHKSLFTKSVLRAITNYLVQQARFGDNILDPSTITAALRAISKKFPKPIPPLDWSFLHIYLQMNFETRKYCILIIKNQIHISGTAKRLFENVLIEFEPNCFEEDLLLLFNIMPEFVQGVSLNVLKTFVEKITLYCFKESQLNGFVEGCLFEKLLESIRSVFISKCESTEILDIFTIIVERYMDAMDLESRLFERYTEAAAALPLNSIEALTAPATWWEVPIGKLKKATIIRCYLVLYNNQIENPLNWLDIIIEAYVNRPDDQLFLFRHLTATFYAFTSLKNSVSWLMELSRQIQTILTEIPVVEKQNKLYLLLDIFVLAVDVFSRVALILGNFDIIASSRESRIALFPESCATLCNELFWKENEIKIYEFLHHLYKNTHVPVYYHDMLRNAIIISRNKPYFDNKNIWTKYVGLRSSN
ncbi:focadhesin [Condylostylus longicornis]|uniref:focadhesin n=1 Tax=Condylostylus longicornis TaxID=2530218 RepID=UPI00244E3C06|nr:focadhesin [Condylostylus longicornis]